MAQTLGQTAVGTIVKINENGSPVDFIVVQQGNPNPSIYSTTFNNGTWLVRQEAFGGFNGTGIMQGDSYLNSTYLNRFVTDFQERILTVLVPHPSLSPANYLQAPAILENGQSAKIFSLDPVEIAGSYVDDVQSNAGSKLSYFTTIDSSNTPTKTTYWLRGMRYASRTNIDWIFRSTYQSGNTVRASAGEQHAYRPVFLLPQSTTVLDDGTISLTAVPPASCTFYTLVVMQGQPVTINWTASPNGTSYILQRKSSADADWVQVYSGSDLTFTETVGSNWTSVQYQVAAVMDGNASAYTQSVVHDVVTTAALVISGEDGNLGTITSDVSYSITSDTGNQISITRKVNDVEVYSGTVSTGFTYNIPIVDLPTGTDNTIVINASVQSSGGSTVTQTRTWTYTKTPITFSSSGGVSELKENDGAIWPATIQEAVRTYDFMGGTLDKTLMTLANAVIKDPVTGGLVGFEGQDIGAAQILVGSYVGTGGNTVTINTPFEPIAIFIWVNTEPPRQDATYGYAYFAGSFCAIRPSNIFMTLSFNPQSGHTESDNYNIVWNSNSVTLTYQSGNFNWVCLNGYQMNYMAIGGQMLS